MRWWAEMMSITVPLVVRQRGVCRRPCLVVSSALKRVLYQWDQPSLEMEPRRDGTPLSTETDLTDHYNADVKPDLTCPPCLSEDWKSPRRPDICSSTGASFISNIQSTFHPEGMSHVLSDSSEPQIQPAESSVDTQQIFTKVFFSCSST